MAKNDPKQLPARHQLRQILEATASMIRADAESALFSQDPPSANSVIANFASAIATYGYADGLAQEGLDGSNVVIDLPNLKRDYRNAARDPRDRIALLAVQAIAEDAQLDPNGVEIVTEPREGLLGKFLTTVMGPKVSLIVPDRGYADKLVAQAKVEVAQSVRAFDTI